MCEYELTEVVEQAYGINKNLKLNNLLINYLNIDVGLKSWRVFISSLIKK